MLTFYDTSYFYDMLKLGGRARVILARGYDLLSCVKRSIKTDTDVTHICMIPSQHIVPSHLQFLKSVYHI